MISRWARSWSPRIFLPINRLLLRIGVTANTLTVAGLVLAVLTGLCIGQNWLMAASAWLALSGLCDALDGELARLQGGGQPEVVGQHELGAKHELGGFIDSVADHYGDFAIMLGLTWRALAMNDPVTVLLAMGALFGSLVGSHIRSRAGMLGIDTKNSGLFTRMERTLVLLLGLLTGWVIPALALLVVGNNFSALQRIGFTLREARRDDGEGRQRMGSE